MLRWRDQWPGGLDPRAYSTLNLLAHCRTGALGYNSARCTECGHQEWYASSCGDRHCPQCLGPRQAQWSQKTCERLPDCAHFHLVFTLPEEVNEVFRDNYRKMAEVFFAAASETIGTFQRNNWGCQQGAYFAVLHTWGSNLSWHPHIHVLISAGGVSARNGRWKSVRANYAFPVKGAMSRVFGAIFLRRLEALDGDAGMQWPQGLKSLEERRAWRVRLAGRHWNIFAKPTVGNTKAVVRYLARYTSRIAMSNQRIKSVDEQRRQVTITYKDYREEGKRKEMTFSGREFLRRFAQHLVPKGFRRIRQYGLLCGRAGRFREVARAPQTCIGESAHQPGNPPCPRCNNQKAWKYGRTHLKGLREWLKSFSLPRPFHASTQHASNKRMDADMDPAPS